MELTPLKGSSTDQTLDRAPPRLLRQRLLPTSSPLLHFSASKKCSVKRYTFMHAAIPTVFKVSLCDRPMLFYFASLTSNDVVLHAFFFVQLEQSLPLTLLPSTSHFYDLLFRRICFICATCPNNIKNCVITFSLFHRPILSLTIFSSLEGSLISIHLLRKSFAKSVFKHPTYEFDASLSSYIVVVTSQNYFLS